MPCPTAPALPLGQVAVACQVTCSRATPKYFITIFYGNILSQYFIAIFYYNILLHYFITIFYHNIFEALYAVTSHVPDVLVWRQTQPWLCCGVLSLVSDLSEVYATPRVRLLCSPRSSPRNILNPQTGAALKKGKKAKKSSGPWHFHKKKKQQNKLMQLPESGLQRGWNPLLATRESTSLGDRRLPAARLALSRSVGGRWLQLQPGLPSFK